MLIINVDQPNGPERAVQDALADLPGVLVGNPKVFTGGRTRETDALVITPTAVFVVEAKGPKKNSPDRGELKVSLNGGWTIAGEPAVFHGGKSAHVQARQAAQTFAEYLREAGALKQFVSAFVSVTGKDLTMSGGPVNLGDVTVALDTDLPEAISTLRKGGISVDEAHAMLTALDLGDLTPTKATLREHGFGGVATATPLYSAPDRDLPTAWSATDPQDLTPAQRRLSGYQPNLPPAAAAGSPTQDRPTEDVARIVAIGKTWAAPPGSAARKRQDKAHRKEQAQWRMEEKRHTDPDGARRDTIRGFILIGIIAAVALGLGWKGWQTWDAAHVSEREAVAMVAEAIGTERPKMAPVTVNESTCNTREKFGFNTVLYICEVQFTGANGKDGWVRAEVEEGPEDESEVRSLYFAGE